MFLICGLKFQSANELWQHIQLNDVTRCSVTAGHLAFLLKMQKCHQKSDTIHVHKYLDRKQSGFILQIENSAETLSVYPYRNMRLNSWRRELYSILFFFPNLSHLPNILVPLKSCTALSVRLAATFLGLQLPLMWSHRRKGGKKPVALLGPSGK